MTSDRLERLRDDLACLNALRQASTIFEFEATGDPPDRYMLTFRGRGLAKAVDDRVEWLELHRCKLRLPYSYPERPPDLHWITTLFHPNVSFGGLLDVNDIGLEWNESIRLDAVCERLWDVARLAYVQLDRAANFAARDWLRRNDGLVLPADPRPLRDRALHAPTNIVRYERRDKRLALSAATTSSELLYIGEDTPVPDVPVRLVTPGRRDGDILFIDE